jgi:hypothetical protein
MFSEKRGILSSLLPHTFLLSFQFNEYLLKLIQLSLPVYWRKGWEKFYILFCKIWCICVHALYKHAFPHSYICTYINMHKNVQINVLGHNEYIWSHIFLSFCQFYCNISNVIKFLFWGTQSHLWVWLVCSYAVDCHGQKTTAVQDFKGLLVENDSSTLVCFC